MSGIPPNLSLLAAIHAAVMLRGTTHPPHPSSTANSNFSSLSSLTSPSSRANSVTFGSDLGSGSSIGDDWQVVQPSTHSTTSIASSSNGSDGWESVPNTPPAPPPNSPAGSTSSQKPIKNLGEK